MSWELHNQLPAKGAKVVVAMSGGVDSSVAAGWLSKNGYQVIGISLQLHDMAEKIDNEFGTCCSLSDLNDARRVAEVLDIPFYVNNMETAFNEAVIDDFVQEYLNMLQHEILLQVFFHTRNPKHILPNYQE